MGVSNLVLESTVSTTKWKFDFKGLENIEKLNEKGQRLFQLVAVDSSPISYKVVDELSETTRGQGGFGSTGK